MKMNTYFIWNINGIFDIQDLFKIVEFMHKDNINASKVPFFSNDDNSNNNNNNNNNNNININKDNNNGNGNNLMNNSNKINATRFKKTKIILTLDIRITPC